MLLTRFRVYFRSYHPEVLTSQSPDCILDYARDDAPFILIERYPGGEDNHGQDSPGEPEIALRISQGDSDGAQDETHGGEQLRGGDSPRAQAIPQRESDHQQSGVRERSQEHSVPDP